MKFNIMGLLLELYGGDRLKTDEKIIFSLLKELMNADN